MAESAKKPGILKRIAKYVRDTKAEMKKVVWPSGKQLVNNTGIVIVAIIIIGLIVFILDSAFASLAALILGK